MAKLQLTKLELIALGRAGNDTDNIFTKAAKKVLTDEQIWEQIKTIFSKESNNNKMVNMSISEEGVVINFTEEFVVDALTTYSKVLLKAVDIFKDLLSVTDEFKAKWLTNEVASDEAKTMRNVLFDLRDNGVSVLDSGPDSYVFIKKIFDNIVKNNNDKLNASKGVDGVDMKLEIVNIETGEVKDFYTAILPQTEEGK